VRRILAAKTRYARPEIVNAAAEATPAVTALKLARHAVTVIRNNGILPLARNERWLLVEPGELTHTGEAGASPTPSLGEFLAPQLAALTVERTSLTPSDDDINRIVQQASDCDGVLLVTRYATRQPAQVKLAQALAVANRNLVVAALPNPYDATVCPDAAAVLTAYDVHRAAVQATCEALLGTLSAKGVLPVTLTSAKGGAA
jgi:hypothetical protein